MNSFLRWVGGKSQMVARITPLLGQCKSYIEPFAGGAWVFFARPSSRFEVLNDLDGELANLYRALQRSGRRLIREVDQYPYSRAVFKRMALSRPRTPLSRARRFLYINRTCFGGRMARPTFGVSKGRANHVLPPTLRFNAEAIIERLRGVVIESLPAGEVIARYDGPDSLFFIDPPYLGLSQPYGVKDVFDRRAHQCLADQLAAIDGRFLLTVNAGPAVRSIYRRFRIRSIQTVYTVSRQSAKTAKELLVSNYPLPRKSPYRERRSPGANKKK